MHTRAENYFMIKCFLGIFIVLGGFGALGAWWASHTGQW